MPRMFRFKNLAVSVLPSDRAAAVLGRLKLCVFHSTICLGISRCQFHTICYWPTLVTCWGWNSPCWAYTPQACPGGSIEPCQNPSIRCPGGSIVCPGGSIACPGGSVYDPGKVELDPVVYVQQVAELKADLRQALAEVEEHEKSLGDVLKPGSLAEAEDVERELKDALKEIDAAKGQLRRKKSD